MRDLEEAGRAVVQHPPAPPTPVDIIETRARRQQRRRTRATVAFATAVVVLAGAAAIAVDRRQSSPAVTRTSQPPKHGAAVPASTVRLRAHLGVGVPKGWMPVDYGDARLWVPSDWAVTAGGCASPSAPGWIELGGPYKLTCETPSNSRRPYVSMRSLSGTDGIGTSKRVINTYAVGAEQDFGLSFGGQFSVPALHVLIEANGNPTSRVLQTLAPSARVIALSAGTQPVPSSWRRISYTDLSIAAPATWPAHLVTPRNAGPACEDLDPKHVWVGVPNLAIQCMVTFTKPLPVDGLWIDHYPVDPGVDPSDPSVPLHGKWGDRIAVRLFTDPLGSELRLDVSVHGYTSELDIGLGRDGRVAKAILQSIRPSSIGSFTVGPPGKS